LGEDGVGMTFEVFFVVESDIERRCVVVWVLRFLGVADDASF
jgi:hypothetical protein